MVVFFPGVWSWKDFSAHNHPIFLILCNWYLSFFFSASQSDDWENLMGFGERESDHSYNLPFLDHAWHRPGELWLRMLRGSQRTMRHRSSETDTNPSNKLGTHPHTQYIPPPPLQSLRGAAHGGGTCGRQRTSCLGTTSEGPGARLCPCHWPSAGSHGSCQPYRWHGQSSRETCSHSWKRMCPV